MSISFGALCLFSIALFNINVSALTYQDEVDVQFTFEPTLSITLSSSALLIDGLMPGNAGSSNTITIGVTSNNLYGYTLNARVGGSGGTPNSSDLVNSATGTSPFSSLATNASTTLSSFNGNEWGYTTASSINNTTTYSGLPYNTDKTINATTNMGGTAKTGYDGGLNTYFTIGAKASSSQIAGDYTNVITFTAVTNVAPPPKIYIQDLTLADCSTDGMTVYDKRDEKSYTVKKLADGNCWMLDNLAIDLTALTQEQLYGTGTNAGKMTNASNTTLSYLKGATSRNPSTDSTGKYATAAVSKAWTSSSSYIRPLIAVDSTTSGVCNTPTTWCVDPSGNGAWSYDTDIPATINDATSKAQGKIGVYYNYCAASAGSYCYGNANTTAGTSVGNATEDICPAGWHMPAGDTANGSYKYLYDQYASASPDQVTAFQTALSTPLSGSFYGGKAYSQGDDGFFWSSTRSSNNYMYHLRVSKSSVTPQSSYSRYNGLSVRCILEAS